MLFFSCLVDFTPRFCSSPAYSFSISKLKAVLGAVYKWTSPTPTPTQASKLSGWFTSDPWLKVTQRLRLRNTYTSSLTTWLFFPWASC